jgi:ornithine cyclodeaminase/alanine dehydrogenase-like protein (mu-crystallin family)
VLVLADADVRSLVTPADAIDVAVELFSGAGEGRSSDAPISEALAGGRLAASIAVDPARSRASLDALASFPREGTLALTVVLADERPEVVAVVESSWLAGLAAGATGALASGRLARRGAASVGLIGCGVHAAAQLACLRAALEVERAVAYCRDRSALERFCAEHGTEPAEYGREASEPDVIVTATTSRDPVLRGDWLRPGSLVCAAGTVSLEARELDNAVLERAAFVCCDSLAVARAAAGDLVEPVERGVLDWLEVHELAEVLDGELEGRQSDTDIVVVKLAGLPTLRLALAALAVERADTRRLRRR